MEVDGYSLEDELNEQFNSITFNPIAADNRNFVREDMLNRGASIEVNRLHAGRSIILQPRRDNIIISQESTEPGNKKRSIENRETTSPDSVAISPTPIVQGATVREDHSVKKFRGRENVALR